MCVCVFVCVFVFVCVCVLGGWGKLILHIPLATSPTPHHPNHTFHHLHIAAPHHTHLQATHSPHIPTTHSHHHHHHHHIPSFTIIYPQIIAGKHDLNSYWAESSPSPVVLVVVCVSRALHNLSSFSPFSSRWPSGRETSKVFLL